MTREPVGIDGLDKALAITERNQKFAMAATILGHTVWIVATMRFLRIVDHSSLAPEHAALIHEAALLLLFLGFATQFMICNYINMMARRILKAIQLATGNHSDG